MNSESKAYWFRAKRYGYGWVPVRWQGWAVLLAYVGGVAADAALLIRNHRPWFFAGLGILLIALFAVCKWKGEPATWRWGDPKDRSR